MYSVLYYNVKSSVSYCVMYTVMYSVLYGVCLSCKDGQNFVADFVVVSL